MDTVAVLLILVFMTIQMCNFDERLTACDIPSFFLITIMSREEKQTDFPEYNTSKAIKNTLI